MAENIYQLHPAACFDQDQHTPQIAVPPAIPTLPMQDHQDVNIDKSGENQEKCSHTPKYLPKVRRNCRQRDEGHTRQCKPAKKAKSLESDFPFVDHVEGLDTIDWRVVTTSEATTDTTLETIGTKTLAQARFGRMVAHSGVTDT
jgi:hypothetical protein